ncbi:hypothetical protein [Embleya hyalina]|uniref:hypothetical protein n=1 Tax=Embleya hyalina TaxID=516124 RepID=UPI001FE43866|nr:hypothetical protein [Embleya hyalina]
MAEQSGRGRGRHRGGQADAGTAGVPARVLPGREAGGGDRQAHDPADALGISRTRLSNLSRACATAALVVAVPVGRRTRCELADARLGIALGTLRAAVLAVGADPSCPDAADRGCCR